MAAQPGCEESQRAHKEKRAGHGREPVPNDLNPDGVRLPRQTVLRERRPAPKSSEISDAGRHETQQFAELVRVVLPEGAARRQQSQRTKQYKKRQPTPCPLPRFARLSTYDRGIYAQKVGQRKSRD